GFMVMVRADSALLRLDDQSAFHQPLHQGLYSPAPIHERLFQPDARVFEVFREQRVAFPFHRRGRARETIADLGPPFNTPVHDAGPGGLQLEICWYILVYTM